MIENAANNVSEHSTHKAKIIRNKQFISNQNKIDNEHAIGLFCMQQWDSNIYGVDMKKNNIVHQEETYDLIDFFTETRDETKTDKNNQTHECLQWTWCS